jgi:hypothetical protein
MAIFTEYIMTTMSVLENIGFGFGYDWYYNVEVAGVGWTLALLYAAGVACGIKGVWGCCGGGKRAEDGMPTGAVASPSAGQAAHVPMMYSGIAYTARSPEFNA